MLLVPPYMECGILGGFFGGKSEEGAEGGVSVSYGLTIDIEPTETGLETRSKCVRVVMSAKP